MDPEQNQSELINDANPLSHAQSLLNLNSENHILQFSGVISNPNVESNILGTLDNQNIHPNGQSNLQPDFYPQSPNNQHQQYNPAMKHMSNSQTGKSQSNSTPKPHSKTKQGEKSSSEKKQNQERQERESSQSFSDQDEDRERTNDQNYSHYTKNTISHNKSFTSDFSKDKSIKTPTPLAQNFGSASASKIKTTTQGQLQNFHNQQDTSNHMQACSGKTSQINQATLLHLPESNFFPDTFHTIQLDNWQKYTDIYDLVDIQREEHIYYYLHLFLLKQMQDPRSQIYQIFNGDPSTGKKCKTSRSASKKYKWLSQDAFKSWSENQKKIIQQKEFLKHHKENIPEALIESQEIPTDLRDAYNDYAYTYRDKFADLLFCHKKKREEARGEDQQRRNNDVQLIKNNDPDSAHDEQLSQLFENLWERLENSEYKNNRDRFHDDLAKLTSFYLHAKKRLTNSKVQQLQIDGKDYTHFELISDIWSRTVRLTSSGLTLDQALWKIHQRNLPINAKGQQQRIDDVSNGTQGIIQTCPYFNLIPGVQNSDQNLNQKKSTQITPQKIIQLANALKTTQQNQIPSQVCIAFSKSTQKFFQIQLTGDVNQQTIMILGNPPGKNLDASSSSTHVIKHKHNLESRQVFDDGKRNKGYYRKKPDVSLQQDQFAQNQINNDIEKIPMALDKEQIEQIRKLLNENEAFGNQGEQQQNLDDILQNQFLNTSLNRFMEESKMDVKDMQLINEFCKWLEQKIQSEKNSNPGQIQSKIQKVPFKNKSAAVLKFNQENELPVVKLESIQRNRDNARHWVVLFKQEKLVVFSRKELKLIWASFGSRKSKINMVCSYGRKYRDKDSGKEKLIHVLNLAFSIRESYRQQTWGDGCWFFADFTTNENRDLLALDLLSRQNTHQATPERANLKMLMIPVLLDTLRECDLECISIGLKCIMPPYDTGDEGLRVLNRSVRDALYKEINKCFIENEKWKNAKGPSANQKKLEQQDNESKFQDLRGLLISKRTVIYAYGDDRIDPIHFSADERDMKVICHHDELRNWVLPRQFKEELFREHNLELQADLPVLTIQFEEQKLEEEKKLKKGNKKQNQYSKFPQAVVLKEEEKKENESDSENAKSRVYQIETTLEEGYSKQRFQRLISIQITQQDKILGELYNNHSGVLPLNENSVLLEKGQISQQKKKPSISTNPPKIEKNKINFYDGQLTSDEIHHYMNGYIRQDFSQVLKTEEGVHDYIKGPNSFEEKFDALRIDQKRKVSRGLTEDGAEMQRVEYTHRFMGSNQYTITGYKSLERRQNMYKSKYSTLKKLYGAWRQQGFLTYQSRRDAISGVKYQQEQKSKQTNPQLKSVQKKCNAVKKKLKIRRPSLKKNFGKLGVTHNDLYWKFDNYERGLGKYEDHDYQRQQRETQAGERQGKSSQHTRGLSDVSYMSQTSQATSSKSRNDQSTYLQISETGSQIEVKVSKEREESESDKFSNSNRDPWGSEAGEADGMETFKSTLVREGKENVDSVVLNYNDESQDLQKTVKIQQKAPRNNLPVPEQINSPKNSINLQQIDGNRSINFTSQDCEKEFNQIPEIFQHKRKIKNSRTLKPLFSKITKQQHVKDLAQAIRESRQSILQNLGSASPSTRLDPDQILFDQFKKQVEQKLGESEYTKQKFFIQSDGITEKELEYGAFLNWDYHQNCSVKDRASRAEISVKFFVLRTLKFVRATEDRTVSDPHSSQINENSNQNENDENDSSAHKSPVKQEYNQKVIGQKRTSYESGIKKKNKKLQKKKKQDGKQNEGEGGDNGQQVEKNGEEDGQRDGNPNQD